jgi:hypothetical protein
VKERVENFEKNREKVKKKAEWKKLKVLVKEKLNDDRVQFIKYEDEMIRKS